MPSTANKGYTIPGFNTEVGTWGTDINTNYTGIVDLNLGGYITVSLSNSNVTLTTGSSGQIQNLIIGLTGTLTANVTVSSAAVGFYFVENNTTGSFTVKWQADFGSGAVGSATLVPQGARMLFISDTTNGARQASATQSLVPSGSLQAYAGSSAPSGWVLCFGQAISRTIFGGLFAAISTTYGVGDGSTTFNVPDLRGRSIFGLDNMGGSAAGRLTGGDTGNITSSTTLGSTGGEENHTILTAEMPSHTHTATVTDPGHSHGYDRITGASGAFGATPANNQSVQQTSTEVTGITVGNSNTGGGGSHNTTPPAMVMNWIIKT
jgi:microcystin-dependent protein